MPGMEVLRRVFNFEWKWASWLSDERNWPEAGWKMVSRCRLWYANLKDFLWRMVVHEDERQKFLGKVEFSVD